MANPCTFDELLDAIENLSPDEQADLVAVIQPRLAERGHRRIVEDVREAHSQFMSGNLKPSSMDDLMREIES